MPNLTAAEAEQMLADLCREAGREAPQLARYIKELEAKVRELRLAAVRQTSSSASMNSRLKDALRE